MLDERAEEMRLEPRIPASVLRRARRRRAANAALAGAVTVGLALGAFVGARALLDQTGRAPTRVQPGGVTEELYPFIYPPTREELNNTAAEVADGSMPMWTDPRGAAILFAVNVMGWEMDDVQASVRGDEPITVVITNPTLNEAAGATADLRTAVYLVRVPDSSPPMYAVLAAQAEGMEIEPVGPDADFGSGGRVEFRGRLSAGPDQAIVVLTVEQTDGRQAETLAGVAPDGTFEISVRTPAGIDPQSLVSLTVTDRQRPTLALTSSRIATPVAGQSEVEVSEPQLAIPARVAETREAILAAAQARDFEAIRALIPNEGFTFTFGGDTDPIRYWKRLESEGHVPVIGDILPGVLGTEPGFDRGVFVWPAQATEDPTTWDETDIEALTTIHAEEDIRSFQEAGLYLGWRVGIDRDGTWVFFVAGD